MDRRRFLYGLLPTLGGCDLPIPNHSFHITQTPSGVINSKYPDGNDGTAVIPLTWSTIPNTLGNVQGTPVTITIRASYLSEPGAPNATLTYVGPPLPPGWAMGADNLTFTGTGAGKVTGQIQAVRNAFTATSNFFQIESIASAGADATAPTIPTGISVITTGTTNTISADPCTDPLVPNAAVSGLKDYRLYKDSVLSQTVASSGLGLSPAFVYSDIGNVGVSGSATQSGANWTVNAAGSQLGGTADSCGTLFAPIVGDCIATLQVASFTASSLSSNVALMMRADMTPGSQAVWIAIKPSGGVGIKVFNRPSAGATVVQNGATITANPPAYFRVVRTGTTTGTSAITCYYSLNGTAWNSAGVTQNIVGLPDTLYVGVAMNSADVTNFCTASIQQLSIQNLAGPTFTDTGNVAGASHNYTVTARDIALNESAVSATANAVTPGGTQTFSLVENWESGVVNPAVWTLLFGTAAPAHIRTVQTAIKRGGNYAIRQYLDRAFLDAYNTTVKGRTEMRLTSSLDVQWDTEYWLGFSVYLKDWNANLEVSSNAAWDIIWQEHDSSGTYTLTTGASSGLNPPLAINTHTDPADGIGKWRCQVLGDSRSLALITNNYAPGPPSYQVNFQQYIAAYVPNKWTDIVINYYPARANPSTGFMRVWFNAASTDPPAFSYSGPVSFPNAGTQANPSAINLDYWKLGIYKGWSASSSVTSRDVYHDEIRLIKATNGGSFNAVNPVTYAGAIP